MENDISLALGIDIGGTTTAVGLVDEKGTVVWEATYATKNFDSADSLIEKIYEVFLPSEWRQQVIGIGIGAPNGNYFTGQIEYAPNLLWKGVIPLVNMFKKRFSLPAWLTNDANAAAIGEKIFGNAHDLEDFVLITLGTGLGSGVYINGELVYGHDGFAGEYGHIRVVPNGRSCGCGRMGCLETYVSATGVVRSVKELESENKSFSCLHSYPNVTAKTVFQSADEGDLFAQEIVEYTASILGSALADYACFSSPKAYILFGGIAQHHGNFATRVKYHLEKNILVIYKNKIDIRTSALHGKNAAVLGSAALVFSNLNA
jgi:glucokinase